MIIDEFQLATGIYDIRYLPCQHTVNTVWQELSIHPKQKKCHCNLPSPISTSSISWPISDSKPLAAKEHTILLSTLHINNKFQLATGIYDIRYLPCQHTVNNIWRELSVHPRQEICHCDSPSSISTDSFLWPT